jgi:hypothetical protein
MPVIELLQLPVPGQTLGPDREIRVEEFAMQVFTFDCWVRVTDTKFAYGCPISGSKLQLIDRLRNFAVDRDQWAT